MSSRHIHKKDDVPTRVCYFCRKRRRCKLVRYPNLTFDVAVCAPCRRTG